LFNIFMTISEIPIAIMIILVYNKYILFCQDPSHHSCKAVWDLIIKEGRVYGKYF
jgi:hypothetical protein